MNRIVIFGLLGRGGNLYYTACLANACAKKYETWCVIPSYSDKTLFSDKVNILTVEAPPNPKGTIKSALSFSKHKAIIDKIKEINPDVIHFKDTHVFYPLYLRKLKRFRVFWTCHDPEFHSGEQKKLINKIDAWVQRALEKRADKILVHGKMWKQYLAERGVPESKIITIKHGAFDFLVKYGDKKTKPRLKTFLFFGRIVAYKGIDTLLKAMPYVLNKDSKAKLIIAGSGDFKPYEQYMIPEIKDNVELIIKFVDDDELTNLFRKSEFVVLPYNDATQSGVIPVAYAFKKPIIITNSGALPEMVVDGKTGILIEKKDERQLADAILKMLSRPAKTKKMGENGYAWMKKELDWDNIVRISYSEE